MNTIKISIIEAGKYVLHEDFTYHSDRYDKDVLVLKGIYDGATGAFDITSNSWWVHDQICKDPFFTDGTPITAWKAAYIIYDILKEEKRWFRKFTWRFMTFFFGCKKTRKNGWFKPSHK